MTADNPACSLTFSPRESARFELRVFRGRSNGVDAATLREELEREKVDVAILRLPAQSLRSVVALTGMELRPIVADTLVNYTTELQTSAHARAGKHLVRLRRADASDAAALEAMVRRIFAGYTNHYHANPLFAPDRILDGYVEWAMHHVASNDEGRFTWMVEADRSAVGFSCVLFDTRSGQSRGVLNGIVPEARGRGLYRAMLQSMLGELADEGSSEFAISTQVHNVAVQRVWAAERFTLDSAENTVHINAMFGRR